MFASGCSLLERGIYICICFSCRLPYILCCCIHCALIRCGLPIVYQSTDSFFICTNGTIGTNRQIVFAWLSGVNEMQLTNGDQLNEKLTIRTNGTNRQASFTMVIFYQWFVCTNGTIGTNRQIVFAWLSGVNEMQLTNGDQLNEKLTNRTNGTNRQASLTMVIFYQWFDW